MKTLSATAATSTPEKRVFDATVWWTVHPDIHPEDAENAFKAWFARTCRDRRKPPHVILEKAVIASAMNDKDGEEVCPPIWKDAKGKVIAVRSDGFETRWKRARKDRKRAPVWDAIDIFILRNWRVFRLDDSKPGLQDWSPKAACAAIRARAIGVNAGGEGWYVKKRTMLGLKGKRRYRVHDFWTCKDGPPRVDID